MPHDPLKHPFLSRPDRTLLILSWPVLLSLIAEPLTGLIDTGFVAQLGSSVALAALGIGTTALSSIFWIFNFLGIGAQTEVARADGGGDRAALERSASLALLLAAGFGTLLALVIWPLTPHLAGLLGGDGAVNDTATVYIQVRLLGGPAILIVLAGSGVLRGLQQMRAAMLVALSINVVNLLLDAPLIFGWGMVPALGVAGAAWASVAGQWVGAIALLLWLRRRLNLTWRVSLSEALALLKVGGDLFVRTGLLTLFLLLATRAANRISPEAGAAHQAIRQVWIFTALALEAFATTAQSLVGYFLGSGQAQVARQVAWVSTRWSLGMGAGLLAIMLLVAGPVMRLLVPADAEVVFMAAWPLAAIFQPLNALAFISDGIHWGTRDYRFLRNAMIAATSTGALGLWLIDTQSGPAFALVWLVTGLWITVRAAFGMARIWPGFGHAPLRAG